MKTNIIILSIITFITSCNNYKEKQDGIMLIKDNRYSINNVHLIKNKEIIDSTELITEFIKKHDLTEADVYTDYDGGNQLADYFNIEIIDKNTFDENKTMAVHMLLPDTVNVEKQKGIMKLPSSKGEISFVDNLSNDENHKEFTYIGIIKYLNVYLLSGIYWEDWNYFFVDRNTGNIGQTFTNMPHLSANGKYIICIDFDTFEGITFIDLYEQGDRKAIIPIIGMYAKKWIPVDLTNSVFWGNDNYLYLAVIHTLDYSNAEENYTGLEQYIRIKPIST